MLALKYGFLLAQPKIGLSEDFQIDVGDWSVVNHMFRSIEGGAKSVFLEQTLYWVQQYKFE